MRLAEENEVDSDDDEPPFDRKHCVEQRIVSEVCETIMPLLEQFAKSKGIESRPDNEEEV